MADTYGDTNGVKVTIQTNQPATRVAKTLMTTGDKRYASLSYVEVTNDGMNTWPEIFSQGPEQAEFDDHLISFMQDNDYFVGSCVRCARRYQIDLECLVDAEDAHISALKGYIFGWFHEHDCEHDAMDKAEDVMHTYIGKANTDGTRMRMEEEINGVVTEIAHEKDRIKTYG